MDPKTLPNVAAEQGVSVALSLFLVVALVALLYKVLADHRRERDGWVAASNERETRHSEERTSWYERQSLLDLQSIEIQREQTRLLSIIADRVGVRGDAVTVATAAAVRVERTGEGGRELP